MSTKRKAQLNPISKDRNPDAITVLRKRLDGTIYWPYFPEPDPEPVLSIFAPRVRNHVSMALIIREQEEERKKKDELHWANGDVHAFNGDVHAFNGDWIEIGWGTDREKGLKLAKMKRKLDEEHWDSLRKKRDYDLPNWVETKYNY
jgi:hypothetical protein